MIQRTIVEIPFCLFLLLFTSIIPWRLYPTFCYGFTPTIDLRHNNELFAKRHLVVIAAAESSSSSDDSNNNDKEGTTKDDDPIEPPYYLASPIEDIKNDNDCLEEEEEENDDNMNVYTVPPPCVIKCIGVGGGGGNAINHMIESNDFVNTGVTFHAINTDAQALSRSKAPNKLNIGTSYTRGLGAGGDPNVGEKAAMESIHDIEEICKDTDMVFITATLGGGTGSGCAPVLAEIAKKDCGCLTVAVVTRPFAFEGKRRMKQANDAIKKLKQNVDTLIVISNEKLLQIVPENTSITDSFIIADNILRQGVMGITNIILQTGLINVDFADVRTVMKDAGLALIGIGTGVGKTRASDAAIEAISSPLLDFPIKNAKRVVFNICGGEDLSLIEVNAASAIIYDNCDDNANIIFGALIDPNMDDELTMTVLACDFDIDNGSLDNSNIVKKPSSDTKSVTTTAKTNATIKKKTSDTINAVPPSKTNDDNDDNNSSSTATTTTNNSSTTKTTPVIIQRNQGFKPPQEPPSKTKKSKLGKFFRKLSKDN